MAFKFSFKRVVGLMLASALTVNASPSLSKAAGPKTASNSQSESVSQSSKRRCKKVSQQDSQHRKKKKCVVAALAEPKAAQHIGVLPFVAITAIAAGAAVAATNSKNCGKGNNSQNKGNCPASP